MHIDAGGGAEGGIQTFRGAAAVAGQARAYQRHTTTRQVQPVLVNGAGRELNVAGLGFS